MGRSSCAKNVLSVVAAVFLLILAIIITLFFIALVVSIGTKVSQLPVHLLHQ